VGEFIFVEKIEVNELPQKTLLRADEVAKFFSVSKSAIYRWVNAGKLLACNPSGGSLRISRESVIDLANETITLKK
jgi:excisionase family DNA binding protein